MNNFYDILVVGAGAAGLTAAIFASSSSDEPLRCLVLERTDKAGKKILMSGGTRCNVLPVSMTLRDYVTDSSPRLLNHIFKSWSVEGCKTWFTEAIQLPLTCEIETNKWFPTSNSAKDVRNALVDKVASQGVEMMYNAQVVALSRHADRWIVKTAAGEEFSANTVIWSTGGLSVPTIGTDGAGHHVLRALGIPIQPTYPALTPVTGQHPGDENLAGVSLTVKLSADTHHASREGFLFTHKGFSGPAVLDVSHAVTRFTIGQGEKPELIVNWTGEERDVWHNRLSKGKGTVRSVLREYLPNRLTEALLTSLDIGDRKVSELSKSDRSRMLSLLTSYPLKWSGHEGYRKAEVTGGGVPLECINTSSMEVKSHKGLYLCGEIMDVFGRIGGFNFYWAWVSGRLAGKSAAEGALRLRAQRQVQGV